MGNEGKLTSWIYFGSIVLAGMCVLGFAVWQIVLSRPGFGAIVVVVLLIPAGHFTVKLPGSVNSKISVSDTLIFANTILFGAATGAATAAMDGLLGSMRVVEERRRLQYALFNVATMSMAAYLAGMVFSLASRSGPLISSPQLDASEIVVPTLLMALTHYLVNSACVAAMVALDMHRSMFAVWREKLLWTAITYFTGASFAAFIALYAREMSLAAITLILPVLAAIYFTYRIYLDRAEEKSHRLQLDKLYLRTVEALTVAIDARESGTLFDARRIQFYAGGLARAMQVQDDIEAKGIEAAALLLDIGNLAVPEYILNNPRQLTKIEFQQVKIHPVVGANILSTIDFPYPVVEFVRHHHERWDGTGYPDRLAGEEIPLGSRVLAVADCYVALTSDRPYQRPRSHDAALEVLRSRAGTAYDPEVLGKFLEIIDRMNREFSKAQRRERAEGSEARAAGGRPSRKAAAPRVPDLVAFKDISKTQKEVAALHEMTQALAATVGLEETLAIIARKTAALLRFSAGTVFLLHELEHRLVAGRVFGAASKLLGGLAVELGEGVSGWSAAQREPVLNGDARQDLMRLKHAPPSNLEHALVMPLVGENRVLGTITLYSTARFTDEDLRVLTNIAQKAAPAVMISLRYEEARDDAVTDALTGLPNVRLLRQSLEEALGSAKTNLDPMAVLVMDLDGFKTINDLYGHQTGDRALTRVARLLQSTLRANDFVARSGGDEFVAALLQTNMLVAFDIAARIREAVRETKIELPSGEQVSVGISVGCSAFPDDGETIEELLAKADGRMYQDKALRGSSRTSLAGTPNS